MVTSQIVWGFWRYWILCQVKFLNFFSICQCFEADEWHVWVNLKIQAIFFGVQGFRGNWYYFAPGKFFSFLCSEVGECQQINNKKNQYKLYGRILRETNSGKDLGAMVDKDKKLKNKIMAQTKKSKQHSYLHYQWVGLKGTLSVNQEIFQILYSTSVQPI